MAVIDKVAALLAKAESTDSQHEAEACVAKAQQLATLHSIDLAMAAGRRARAKETPTQRTITVGEPRKHANPHLVRLFSAIARANDVSIDIAHNSTYVIAFGMPTDIDTTEAIWLACAPMMVAGAAEWIREGSWRTDLMYVSGGNEPGLRRASARAAKSAFSDAFTSRVGARLMEARAQGIQEADAHAADAVQSTQGDRGDASSGAELVLVAKAEAVRSFHQENSRAKGAWRGYRGGQVLEHSDSHRAGDKAGRKARLAPIRQIGGKAGSLGSQ